MEQQRASRTKNTRLTLLSLTFLLIMLGSTLSIVVAYEYYFSTKRRQIPCGLVIKPYPIIIQDIVIDPLIPDYESKVTITATITGEDVEALLYCTHNSAWHNVPMTKSGDIYNATIPQQPYGTLVQYRIYASDIHGYLKESAIQSYMVADFVAPEVDLSRSLTIPQSSQAVHVYANVTEPLNASGVKPPVFFCYRINSGPWWNTTMTFNEALKLYETTIPQQQPTAVVEYFVKAFDNAENVNATTTHSYTVALAGDVNFDHSINVFDILAVKRRWGTTASGPNWIPEYDVNDDGAINVFDILLIKANWGQTW